jgi:phage-related holin
MKNMEPIGKKIEALFTKGEAIFGWLSGMAVSFVSPVAPFIAVALGLIIVDAITGVLASKKNGDKITSRGYFRTVQKIVVYTGAILSCEAVHVVFLPAIPITYGASLAIVMTELKSVLENTQVVSGVNVFEQIKGMLPKQEPEEKDQ